MRSLPQSPMVRHLGPWSLPMARVMRCSIGSEPDQQPSSVMLAIGIVQRHGTGVVEVGARRGAHG